MHIEVENFLSVEDYTESYTDSVLSHQSEINRFLISRVGCPECANDIFQSILEKIIDRRSEVPIENIRAFLYRSAKNATLNLRREQCTRDKLTMLVSPLIDGKHEDSPEAEVEAIQVIEMMDQAFNSLPVMTREIFTFFRLHSMKQKDIAQQMDVSVSTVEKHVKKALDCFRSCLD